MIRQPIYLVSLTLLALWGAAPVFRPASAQAELPLTVVMAASAGIANIELGTLRRAFSGYPTELQGKRLIPFNHAVGAVERVQFDKLVLGFTPDQVGRYWIDQKVRQGSLAPRTLPPEMVVRVVASLTGAISYVYTPAKNLPTEARALTVDGKAAGAPDYPLLTH
jgi:hypothetical protein